jgi:hypothetical protein
MTPRIEPLGDGERKWIEAHLRIARSFVAEYAQVETETLPTPEALDGAWSAWLAQWERHDPNHIINAVGMAIGEHLIAELGLAWVLATDEYGTELAVHGEPNNVLIFPANLVGKRFESRTTNFIAPLLKQMCEDVRRLRAEDRPS